MKTTSQTTDATSTAPQVLESWVTKNTVALHLGIGVRTVNTWMKRRILPYLKVGRIVRFNLIACDAATQKYQTQGRNY